MSDLPPHRPPRGEPLRCPLDGSRLVELERNDVLIDACPECRGVWLDRGELDRILEKERRSLVHGDPDDDFLAEMGGRRQGPLAPQPPPPPRPAGRERYDDDRHDDRYRKKKRKRSILEDLFDFD